MKDINQQIAEQVMGWCWKKQQGGSYWITDKGWGTDNVPEYSTNISDAWLVVEKMREYADCTHKDWLNGRHRVWIKFCAEIINITGYGPEFQSTFLKVSPENICKAALAAINAA